MRTQFGVLLLLALWVVHTDAWFWSWTGPTTLPPTVDNEGSGSQAGSGEPPSENIARTGLEIIDEGHGIQKVVQTLDETTQAPRLTTTTQPENEHASEKGAAGISSRKHKPGNATFSLKGTSSESSGHLRFTENVSRSGSGLESELTSDTVSGLWFGSGSGSGSKSGFGTGPETSRGTEENQQGEVMPTDLRGLESGDSIVSQTNELKFDNSTITTHKETDEGYYIGSTKPEQNLAPNNKENTKLNGSSRQNGNAFNFTKNTHENSTPGDLITPIEGNNSVTKDNQVEGVNKLPATESTAKQETLANKMLWTTQAPFAIQTLSTTQTQTATPKMFFTPFQTISKKPDTTSIPTAAQSQLPSQASATSQTAVTTQVGYFLEATQTPLNEHEPSQATLISQAVVGDLGVGMSSLKDMGLGGSDHLGSGSGLESKLALDTVSGYESQFVTKHEITWGPEETQQGVFMPTILSLVEAAQLPARESTAKKEALPNQMLWTTQASFSKTQSTTQTPATTLKMLFTPLQTGSEKPETTSRPSSQWPSQASVTSQKVFSQKSHILDATQPSVTENESAQASSLSQTAVGRLDIVTKLSLEDGSGPWSGSGFRSESGFGPEPETSWGSKENQQGGVIPTHHKYSDSGDNVLAQANKLKFKFKSSTSVGHGETEEGHNIGSRKLVQNLDLSFKTAQKDIEFRKLNGSSGWNASDFNLAKYSNDNSTKGNVLTPVVGSNSVSTTQVIEDNPVVEVTQLTGSASTAKQEPLPNQVFQTTQASFTKTSWESEENQQGKIMPTDRSLVEITQLLNQGLQTTQGSFASQTLSTTQPPTTTPKMLFTPLQTAGEKPERTSVPTTAQSQVPSHASATSQKVVTSQSGHVLDATESDPTEATSISQTDVGKWMQTESHTEFTGSALVVESPQCLLVDTDLPFCSSMVGEQIVVPNYLNQSTLAEIQELLNNWAWLLKSRCHHSLEWFFCLLLVPKCGSMVPLPVLPCQSFCEILRDSCWTLLDEGRLPVECHILPDEEDDGYQCLSVSNQKGNHCFKLILVCGFILNQFSISLLPSLSGFTPTTQYPPQK